MAKSQSTQTSKLITPAHEDYLKAIYTLSRGGEKVTNSALAHHMGVSPASATNMVKKLADLGLLTYERYQNIALTASGEKVALEVLRHHRLLELYLHNKLNVPWDQVHAEAERLEHVLSETLEDAMAAALGHPTIDPHGDPIPSKDGYIQDVPGILLSAAELNCAYEVLRVLVQDSERLIYLGSLGLYPNAIVTVLDRAPFNGPLLIDVGGEHYALAHDMAEYLVVQKASSLS